MDRQQEINSLHEQIKDLKDSIDSYKARTLDSIEKQRESFASETTLHVQLSELSTELAAMQQAHDSLQTSLVHATKRYTVAEESLSIMNQEAAIQRQRIDSIMVGLSSVKTGRTPTDSPRSARVTPSSTPQHAKHFSFPSGMDQMTGTGTGTGTGTTTGAVAASSLGASDHVEQRLSHVQSVITDLQNQLDLERSHVATKATRILQLSSELEFARVDLDLKCSELENRQIHIARMEADHSEFESREQKLTI